MLGPMLVALRHVAEHAMPVGLAFAFALTVPSVRESQGLLGLVFGCLLAFASSRHLLSWVLGFGVHLVPYTLQGLLVLEYFRGCRASGCITRSWCRRLIGRRHLQKSGAGLCEESRGWVL